LLEGEVRGLGGDQSIFEHRSVLGMASETAAGKGNHFVTGLEQRHVAPDGVDDLRQLGSEDRLPWPQQPERQPASRPKPGGMVRLRARQSPELTVLARMRIRTSFGFGDGLGTSSSATTSGPPYRR
jgi:hypothetical protein